jgi:hypothetical protein
VNAGFGVEASYYHKDKMDFKLNIRKTYGAHFYDFNRDLANNNSNVSNKPQAFTYYELGATYHVKDFDQSGTTKMVLYKKSFRGNRWASMVPLRAEIPCKVRKIYGARLGGIVWAGTADLGRALKKQNLTNANLVDGNGVGLPLQTQPDPITSQTNTFNAFSNISATNVYLGGSMSWFRNVAVSFDKYEEGLDDGMLTVFFDVLIAPAIKLDPVRYNGDVYSTKALKTSPIGVRAGLDGKFNRMLSWSYGGEIGVRPSLQGSGLYVLFKLAFPVFGTNLDYKVESFGK